MTLYALLLAALVCSLHYCAVMAQPTVTLSEEEHLELEMQLKVLNKPAVKTIKTKHGHTYDCVDFYKQPAFDHPSLQNHTFHLQMRPSSIPTRMRNEESSSETMKIGLEERCPIGTVPIRRTTKDDLIRAKLHDKTYGPFTEYSVYSAVVQTKVDPLKKYNGAGSTITVYNPKVTHNEFSTGQMRLQNGVDDVIQVGWMVNPILYGDDRTHLFIFTKNNATLCFNTRCPGFITVNTGIPVDAVIDKTSIPEQSYAVNFLIFRDKINGNWWLFLGPKYEQIGFWPAKIFSGLAGPATAIDWGGEVFWPYKTETPPVMGSGNWPVVGNSKYDADSRNITTIDEDNVQADAVDLETFSLNYTEYQVIDKGFSGPDFGHIAFWGGKGAH